MILDILNQLAATPSRNEKEDILTQHKYNVELREVFRLAYDPRTNFYIKKIPSFVTEEKPYHTLQSGLTKLNKLINREVTGNAATEYVKLLLSEFNENDAEVIKRILLKDLRCGVSTSTINKIWVNLVEDIPYMRCSLLKDMKNPNWNDGIFSQTKEDGAFCNINYWYDYERDTPFDIEMYTRNGTAYDISNFVEIVSLFENHMQLGYQYHGELLVEEDGKILSREIGNGILNSVLKGGEFESNQKPILVLWDMVPIQYTTTNKATCSIPYNVRLSQLYELINEIEDSNSIKLVDTEIVYSYEQALEVYSKALENGKEGTILKYPESVWKDGTSKQMFKLKIEVDVDLIITKFNAGKGKNAKTFGSIECQTSDGLLVVNVSGFKDKDREELSKNRESVIGKIMTVRGNNLMKSKTPYSIFLPRYVEIRNDKTEADSLQKVIDQFESAMMLK